jgi:addiction module HigA family antidote
MRSNGYGPSSKISPGMVFDCLCLQSAGMAFISLDHRVDTAEDIGFVVQL